MRVEYSCVYVSNKEHNHVCKIDLKNTIIRHKQKAYGPRFAQLSKTIVVYLQMPCNNLPVLPQQLQHTFDRAIKSSNIIIGSSFEQTW